MKPKPGRTRSRKTARAGRSSSIDGLIARTALGQGRHGTRESSYSKLLRELASSEAGDGRKIRVALAANDAECAGQTGRTPSREWPADFGRRTGKEAADVVEKRCNDGSSDGQA